MFRDDVRAFVKRNRLPLVSGPIVTGESGLAHRFDYATNIQDQHKLIRLVPFMDHKSASSLLFAWKDSEAVRSRDTRLLALFDDSRRQLGADTREAFLHYRVQTLPWSQRDNLMRVLEAG